MQHKRSPALDSQIEPVQGVTRDGQPISYNRAPAPDLEPYVGRFYVTKVDMPADYTLSCGLLNDVSCVRIQLAGDWAAETADGPLTARREAMFFGPQRRKMPISVTGSFISVGIHLRPGACAALGTPLPPDTLDRIRPTDASTVDPEAIIAALTPDGSPEDWITTIEDHLRKAVARAGGKLPDPVTVAFEELAFVNPTMTVAEAAERCGVERRKLERVIARDFGLSPKKVLRRARALDMASHLRGVADEAEGEAIVLRYYDESHLIREFTELFGMSPRHFVATPQPIMTLALESRQAHRLEALKRLQPGESRPWER
ncbi:helix-turn-helix domain-containing protein [Novosphingobium sp. 9]|uniref:helix-turn-helix domain-containing protein n=1 Tax=Novosphingobium sp. 9 TaxID=2025349 RepID=UPI0021B564E5|nr:helix-turn-helix domain-containing protein [Novosphingobium sp. 9]